MRESRARLRAERGKATAHTLPFWWGLRRVQTDCRRRVWARTAGMMGLPFPETVKRVGALGAMRTGPESDFGCVSVDAHRASLWGFRREMCESHIRGGTAGRGRHTVAHSEAASVDRDGAD